MDRQVNLDELWVIGYILMGAAFADGSMDGDEAETIVDIVAELLGDVDVPPDLHPHLEAFDNSIFDVAKAALQLHLNGPDDRRALLSLVARVVEADEVYDIREDHYIRKLGEAIGATEEEYEAALSGDLEIGWISSLDIVEVEVSQAPPAVPVPDIPDVPGA